MKNTKKTQLSLDEEMLFWTSYRYCIGRHTYVNSLAEYMAKKYWTLLSDDQKRHAANDINLQIIDQLQMSPINLRYDWNVPNNERRGLEDLFDFMIKTDISKEDFFKIKNITFYKDKGELKTTVEYTATPQDIVKYSICFEDLMPWLRLSEFFNIDKHKTIEVNGKTVSVFESYREKDKLCEDGYYRLEPYKFEKCYVSVEDMKNGICVRSTIDYENQG